MTQGVFLYYVPGKQRTEITAADLAGNPILASPFFELIHSPRMLKERMIGGNVINAGPDNGSGCVIGIQPQVTTDQIPGYFPDRQTWQKYGEQWIGYQNDMRPGPESLRRASQFDGYEVEMGDGLIWNAPVVKRFEESEIRWDDCLPMKWGIGANLEPTASPVERYVEAWRTAGRIYATVIGGMPASMVDSMGWSAQCLSLNYRVGLVEVSILELLSDETIRQVLHSAIDIPKVEAADRKAVEPENPQ